MDAGDLVPDEVTNGMVKDRLSHDDTSEGFLLDGFPRTVQQAVVLDDMLAVHAVGLDVVLELVVDDEEVVRRLSGRRTCRRCGQGDPGAVHRVALRRPQDLDGGHLPDQRQRRDRARPRGEEVHGRR